MPSKPWTTIIFPVYTLISKSSKSLLYAFFASFTFVNVTMDQYKQYEFLISFLWLCDIYHFPPVPFKHYTRRHRPNESLLNSVEDISLMSAVFRLGQPEAELVKVILARTHCVEVLTQWILSELEGKCIRLHTLASYSEPVANTTYIRKKRCLIVGGRTHDSGLRGG